jgi:hypothetical protein
MLSFLAFSTIYSSDCDGRIWILETKLRFYTLEVRAFQVYLVDLSILTLTQTRAAKSKEVKK